MRQSGKNIQSLEMTAHCWINSPESLNDQIIMGFTVLCTNLGRTQKVGGENLHSMTVKHRPLGRAGKRFQPLYRLLIPRLDIF